MDYQTNMVKLAKNIARTAQDMVRTISEFNKGVWGALWYFIWLKRFNCEAIFIIF